MVDTANVYIEDGGRNAAASEHDVTNAAPGTPVISRRRFLRSAGVAVAAAVASGCTTPRPAGPSGGKVQLVYQDWLTGWFPAMAQAALDEFHAGHPNIRVFYVPDPDNAHYQERVLADMQTGTMADVFQGCCTQFPTWAEQGYTVDLRPYVAADLDRETIADWDPAQYKALFSPDGKQFGVPKYHGALALYYNKDLFRESGVDFPTENWTHDDYLAAMKRLTRYSSGQPATWGSMLDVIWDRIQVHVNAWGGHYVDPQNPRHALIAQPQALAALQWLRERMWNDRVVPSPADVQQMGTHEAFVAGKVAMVEDGSWALKDVLSKAPFEVGVAPFPAGPVRRATLATTDGFGIYAGTKHPEAAWELIKFLISKNYGRRMAQVAFLQPARASLVDEWTGFIRAEFPQKAKDVDIAAFAHGHRNGYSVTAEVFANMADATRIAGAAWEQILTFGKMPVDHMVQAAQEIEQAQGS